MKARLKSGDMVRIIRAPKKAEYLQGMVVEVVYTSPLCVKTPNGFTHLAKSAVEKVG